MASTGDFIYSRLSADGTVSASVSNISPQWVQENTALPYVSYQLIASNPIGVKNQDSFQDKELWQISVFHTVHRSAKTLAQAIRDNLEGYAGTTASVVVKNVVYEGTSEDSDGKVFQVNVDLEINRVV